MSPVTPLLTWLVLLAAFANSCTPKRLSGIRFYDENRVSKRWFSVGKWEVEAEGLRTTWLQQDNGMHEIRYCFMDEDDYDDLNDILQAAIKVWEPAFAVSSMRIVPRTSEAPHVCRQGDQDSLIIMSKTQQDTVGLDRSCAMGYSSGDRENQMVFNLAMPGRGWDDEKAQREYDIHTMAHELGHAMGLAHEHQRPDAWKYIRLQCKYLHDYEHVKGLIDSKDEDFYEKGDTVKRACEDMETASRYDFTAKEYMPYPSTSVGNGMIGELGHSQKFDFDSIMLYESYQTYPVQRPDFKWTNGAVLIGQQGPEMGAKKFELLPGGIKKGGGDVLDYSSPKISEGDIARITQMYPAVGGEVYAGKEEWKGVWSPINMAAGGRP